MGKSKKVLIVALALIAVFVSIYFIGALYYGNLFLPNTYINGINYGGKTVMEVENNITNDTGEYVLSLIKIDGTTEEIKGTDFSYDIKTGTQIKDIKENQNSFYWLPMLFKTSEYNIKTTPSYDEEKLTKLVETLDCVTSAATVAPENAYIDHTEDGYIIVPEKKGNKLDIEKTKSAVITAVKDGSNELNLEESGCYKVADITSSSEEITSIMNKIKNITDITITYDFEDRTETIDSSLLAKWVTVDEENNIVLDDKKIKQYITNLAAKYDTYQTDRKFKTTAGKEITVGGGIYGWQTDITKSVTALKEAILEGKDVTIEPVYKIEGYSRATDDIGNTYIEISIKDQHMWFYVDGELYVDTDVVTGLSNGKRDTPTGVFCLWSREKNRTLGQYDDEGYQTFVNYWMPIDWTGVGIHDATWRSSFGSDIYKTDGSHGCINTPYDAVQKIFEKVKTGTPVIIY